jgi:hypothetical protein
MINDIFVGAMAGLAANQAQGKLDDLQGNPDPGDHIECLHRDAHSVKEYLKQIRDILANAAPVTQLMTVPVQPGFIRLPLMGHSHSYIFVPNSTTQLIFDVPGLGQFAYTPALGWTQLDLPNNTGIAVGNGGNPINILYRVTSSSQ